MHDLQDVTGECLRCLAVTEFNFLLFERIAERHQFELRHRVTVSNAFFGALIAVVVILLVPLDPGGVIRVGALQGGQQRSARERRRNLIRCEVMDDVRFAVLVAHGWVHGYNVFDEDGECRYVLRLQLRARDPGLWRCLRPACVARASHSLGPVLDLHDGPYSLRQRLELGEHAVAPCRKRLEHVLAPSVCFLLEVEVPPNHCEHVCHPLQAQSAPGSQFFLQFWAVQGCAVPYKVADDDKHTLVHVPVRGRHVRIEGLDCTKPPCDAVLLAVPATADEEKDHVDGAAHNPDEFCCPVFFLQRFHPGIQAGQDLRKGVAGHCIPGFLSALSDVGDEVSKDLERVFGLDPSVLCNVIDIFVEFKDAERFPQRL